jgi:GNAT superfamily N-acetyltransferase
MFDIRRGTARDYDALARFHYCAGRPASFAAIWTAHLADTTTPVGVAILSWPPADSLDRHRHFAIGNLPPRDRLTFANAHLRTVSRVVVHPRCRGLGLGVALVRRCAAECPSPYVEAMARMGWAHPLFERAGFARITPPGDETRPVYYVAKTIDFRGESK